MKKPPDRHRRAVRRVSRQAIVRPSSRGGVPVFRRPRRGPPPPAVRRARSRFSSPTRPAGIGSSPIWIRPCKNVPVVKTTAPVVKRPAIDGLYAGDSISFSTGNPSPRLRQPRYAVPSPGVATESPAGRACGRLGCVAAHRRPLAAIENLGTGFRRHRRPRPMTPSRASISRTRCPFPSPPIAGLHDMTPRPSRRKGHQGRPRAKPRRSPRPLRSRHARRRPRLH